MKLIKYFLLFIFCHASGQNLTGIVTDTLLSPLENANVIAKPLQQNASIKFAIADNKGRYKVELEKEVSCG